MAANYYGLRSGFFMSKRLLCSGLMLGLGMASGALAEGDPLPISGKLILTGGVSQVEGSGGGGLTPWAVIGSYGTRDQVGASAYYTKVSLTDFTVTSYGVRATWRDRVEVSVSRQDFDTEAVGAALGLGHGYTISQDTIGLKVKVYGDAVIEQDKPWPQISVGAQFKSNRNGDLVKALGAREDDGVDYYVSATKLYLDKSLLLNATLRATKANQYGILGYGGINDDYHLMAEGSAALLLNRKLAVGVEVRNKPDNLAVAKETRAWDAFVAYAPTKNLSFTLAYVDLGNIVVGPQRGLYLSLQAGF